MRRSTLRYWIALMACGVVLGDGATARLSSAADSDGPRRSPPRVGRRLDPRLGKALAEKTDIEFVEAPLQDVVDYLKDLHKIEIQFDTKALEYANIGVDMPITRNLKGISLESGLDLILGAMELTWVADGDLVIVTTPAVAESALSVRLYDCGWATTAQFSDLVAVVKLVDIRRRAEAKNAQQPGGDAHAAPEESSDFKLVPFGSMLAVRASGLEHQMIARLLDELRAAVDAKGTEPAQTGKAR